MMRLQIFVALAVVGLSACAMEEDTGRCIPFEVSTQALSASPCSSTKASKPDVSSVRVKIVDQTEAGLQTVADELFSAESGVYEICDVPESTSLELVALWLKAGAKGGEPAYYSKYKHLSVAKNETSDIYVTPMRYGDYTCPSDPPKSAPNVMFPSVVNLPDGRVLIAGGFAKVVEETGRWQLTGASDLAYIVDPTGGKIAQIGSQMNKGRGAAGAVYLPAEDLVLIVGGAEVMFMEQPKDKAVACFPFYYLKDKAGAVGFTYEIFDLKTNSFFQWDNGWPDMTHELVKQARRVFPALALGNDGSVLVTGGGQWPSCQTQMETDTDYRGAEFYRPTSEFGQSGFVDNFNALTMMAMRSGHTAVYLETKDKLNYTLFWGGSTDGAEAEIYKESSAQLEGNYGAFSEVVWLDKSAYKGKRPFFHSITRLRDRTFLLTGGVNYKSGIKPPSASDAFLIKVTSDQKVNISEVKGLGIGRYFHTATTYDDEHVIVIGGYSSAQVKDDLTFGTTASADVRFFNLTAGQFDGTIPDAPGLPRAGLGTVPLRNDCLLLVGGVDTLKEGLEFGGKTVQLLLESYCPSTVCPEGLWATACYPAD